MIPAGLGALVAAVLCTWVFVGMTARADSRAGGTSRMTRPSRTWLYAALGLSAVGVLLLAGRVGGLWVR